MRRSNRQRQSPASPDAPCPACGSKDIYRVHRKAGERFRALSVQGTGYSKLEGDYRIAFSDHLEHSCRACQKLWGTRLNGRVKVRQDNKVGGGAVIPFTCQVLLPIFFCGECDREYSLIAQNGRRSVEQGPRFCPYCGTKDPGPTKTQEDWLSRLREDSLKEYPATHNPPPGQTGPTLDSSGSESTPDP